MKIGFIGGSITQGGCASRYENSWPHLTYLGLKERDPSAVCYNAAISGTNSCFGLFRIREHLLTYDPDVIFTEFSVNDKWLRTTPSDPVMYMDALVRTIAADCPRCAVIFVYTGSRDRITRLPEHSIVADRYGIPGIDMGAELYRITDAGGNWSDYMKDDVHPLDRGHRLYADTVLRYIDSHPECLTTPPRVPDTPASFMPRRPRILPPDAAYALTGFRTETVGTDRAKPLDALNIRRALVSDVPGSSFSVDFRGRAFGLYHLLGPMCGRVRISIDGMPEYEADLYYPANGPHGEYLCDVMRCDLTDGPHTARVTVCEPGPGRGCRCGIAGFVAED